MPLEHDGSRQAPARHGDHSLNGPGLRTPAPASRATGEEDRVAEGRDSNSGDATAANGFETAPKPPQSRIRIRIAGE